MKGIKEYMMQIPSRRLRLSAVALTMTWVVGVVLAAQSTDVSPHLSTSALSPAAKKEQNQYALSMLAASLGPAQQGAQAAGRKLMVEDVFKNIQVLKGIPVDEFMGTMGIMANSLGFCCNDCHAGAGTDTVVWEADTPNKRTARRMVTMLQTINKDNFGGRQVVTCWTCHRGRDFPVVTESFDQVYGEPVLELDDILKPADGVPSVDQILDKYTQAIGGAQRLAGMKSFIAKGTGEGFFGLGGAAQIEIFANAPNQRATYIHFPDAKRGDAVWTFDGRTGWMAVPLAAVRKYELSGGELDGARIDAQLSFPGQIKTALSNLHVGSLTTINDRQVYVLQGNGLRGSFANLYFDKDSGLLTRILRFTPSAIGRVPTQTDYSDFRDVNGIKMPFSITFSWLDGRNTLKLSGVQMNVPIDAAKFGEPNPLAR